MKIYTKTGDNGTTALFGGRRLPKSDPQVVAYGSVDELTSFIGLLLAKITSESDKKFLTDIQKDLYAIMACLAGSPSKLNCLNSSILKFEKKIDGIDKKLPKLNRFILPQGTELSGWFHILRTQTRKAERNIVAYFNKLEIGNWKLEIFQYLNRLSDLFFMMARWYGKEKEIST